MRISRTYITLGLLVLSIVLKFFGVDIDLPSPGDVPVDGWSLMTLLEVVFTLLAGFFRAKARERVTALGVKTGEPLSGPGG